MERRRTDSETSEVIRVRNQYYILATAAIADDRTLVLKHGETFAIYDREGDIRIVGTGGQGLYHKGTRFLSRSVLRLHEDRPMLLGSTVTEDNILVSVDMTNPDMTNEGVFLRRGTLHLFRSRFLLDGTSYERLRIFNHGDLEITVGLTLELSADFADIFEVRGVERSKRGTADAPVASANSVLFSYTGLDGVVRRTRATVTPDARAEESRLHMTASVPPKQHKEFYLTIACEEIGTEESTDRYDVAIVRRRELATRYAAGQCRITSSSDQFNTMLGRSAADLAMMVTDTPAGPFPYGGVPWFSSPFGRDAIITAYSMLWANPRVAKGVLAYLAATQATDEDPVRESQPGKILHEQRTGEMAALGEVPFGLYYGSVDATPLYVALAGEYLASTGDLTFVEEIWPNVVAALDWIEHYGDLDGDGFVEYRASPGKGLVQQGWKDSNDSVFHADGTIAADPIALCEVQGYVYWAKRRASEIAIALGEIERAEALTKQARRLRDDFNAAYWSDDLGMYALALDGTKRQCEVRASNAGHCLLSGIATVDKANELATELLSDALFSGWGVRTLATSEARYGPITYHNGSVWPHDNALIANGLARYGHKEGVQMILGGLLAASESFELHRLPELFCGFARRPGQGPVSYPLACAPQSWAAAAVFLLLRACLGIEIDAVAHQVRLAYPSLPPYLDVVRIEGLRCGAASVDLSLHRYPDDVGVNVVRREGDVEVVTIA
jgi:glycogen debranching enzyme